MNYKRTISNDSERFKINQSNIVVLAMHLGTDICLLNWRQTMQLGNLLCWKQNGNRVQYRERKRFVKQVCYQRLINDVWVSNWIRDSDLKFSSRTIGTANHWVDSWEILHILGKVLVFEASTSLYTAVLFHLKINILLIWNLSSQIYLILWKYKSVQFCFPCHTLSSLIV